VRTAAEAALDEHTDVVVTDHDRPELGDVLAEVLEHRTRWVGVMGSPRHTAPHVAALAERGVAPEVVARVHRPIGLDIGSRSPAEIACRRWPGCSPTATAGPAGSTRRREARRPRRWHRRRAFLRGLQAAVPDAELTVVVNTGDDITHVRPADLPRPRHGDVHPRRRHRRAARLGASDETFHAREELQAYDVPTAWFGLGDRDLATHLVRRQMLDAGYPLSQVTRRCAPAGSPARRCCR
jgi:hypothetical protein